MIILVCSWLLDARAMPRKVFHYTLFTIQGTPAGILSLQFNHTVPTSPGDPLFSKWGPDGDPNFSEMGTKWGPSPAEWGPKKRMFAKLIETS